MINRTYDKFKLFRTYIGGSKKKELESFLATRGGTDNGSEADWFEFRRLVIVQFEDILHVTCSRKQTVDALMKLDLPAAIDVEIKAFGTEHK